LNTHTEAEKIGERKCNGSGGCVLLKRTRDESNRIVVVVVGMVVLYYK
jgi:hypothetical protein